MTISKEMLQVEEMSFGSFHFSIVLVAVTLWMSSWSVFVCSFLCLLKSGQPLIILLDSVGPGNYSINKCSWFWRRAWLSIVGAFICVWRTLKPVQKSKAWLSKQPCIGLTAWPGKGVRIWWRTPLPISIPSQVRSPHPIPPYRTLWPLLPAQ